MLLVLVEMAVLRIKRTWPGSRSGRTWSGSNEDVGGSYFGRNLGGEGPEWLGGESERWVAKGSASCLWNAVAQLCRS